MIQPNSGIELTTQFGSPPPAFSVISTQYGRLYGAINNRVHYSEALQPGLFMPNNYLPFNKKVRLIVAVKSALYVVTDKTYRIGNMDGEGFPAITEVLPLGGCGAVAYDPAQTMAVWMSDKGYIVATEENVQLLAYDRIAVEKYTKGAITIFEEDGLKKIVGTFR